jgi:hypothetical protein
MLGIHSRPPCPLSVTDFLHNRFYHLNSSDTPRTEGTWDAVMRLIGQAHTLVHQNGILRVQTDIRAGTR